MEWFLLGIAFCFWQALHKEKFTMEARDSNLKMISAFDNLLLRPQIRQVNLLTILYFCCKTIAILQQLLLHI